MSILTNKRIISEGDLVIIWSGREYTTFLKIISGKIFQNKRGIFLHNDMIGKEYGTKVIIIYYNKYIFFFKNKKIYSKNKEGWVYILNPTAELWSRTLHLRTQILFSLDISMIIANLYLKPGCIVIESGTGSGNLSTAIARTISPNGHLYTFEINKERVIAATQDFSINGTNSLITVIHRDVCKEGFGIEGNK